MRYLPSVDTFQTEIQKVLSVSSVFEDEEPYTDRKTLLAEEAADRKRPLPAGDELPRERP